MSSCQRCKQTSNGPQAFLLTCRGCNKTWHHRCHMPPVEDEELIRRIRASNAGDTANDLSAWMCRRCKKGVSETPSTTSDRETTVLASSDSRDDRKSSSTSRYRPASTDITTSTSTASVASTVDVRVKQESNTTARASLLDDRERIEKSDRPDSTKTAPAKHVIYAKRARPSAANRPHLQLPQPAPARVDVRMGDITPTKSTPREKMSSTQRPSFSIPLHRGKSARKSFSTAPATSSEDDVEMNIEVTPPNFPEPTSRATPQVSQVPLDDQVMKPLSIAEVPPLNDVHVASPNSEREREVRSVDEAVVQPQVSQDVANEIQDDPEDLYGPPVERRIVRILPSLAEELREQQRRVAAEKEKRRTPLAPDWIYAKHAHDPSWKEIITVGGKRRKPIARKLGDNGLNVSELLGCFTVQNWVQEYKT